MSKRRFVGAACAVAAAALLAVYAVPAGASSTQQSTLEPGAFRGLANGSALDLTLLGQQVTLGLSDATVDAAPTASAEGVGALLGEVLGGDFVQQTTASSSATTPQDGSTEESCSPLSLAIPPGEQAPLVDVATVCSSAFTEVTDGNPHANATGSVLELAVDDMELLSQLLGGLNLEETLDGVLGPVTDQVDGLLGSLGLSVGDTVGDLLDTVVEGGNLLEVELAKTESDVNTTDADVTSMASSEAIVVNVAQTIDGVPLARVTIGEADATATANRATGAAEGEATPALVTVELAPVLNDILAGLGLSTELPINLSDLGELCLEPILCLTASSGTVTDTADGGKRAEATTLGISLLGMPELQDGVQLKLASAVAEAAAAPAAQEEQATTTAAPDGEQPRELAKTGGESGFVLPMVLLATAVGGLGIARWAGRRRLASE